MSKRVTLKDVAEDAGVSRATASLVLRDSPLVATHTRARVRASMQRLGYVYNRVAASLRAQQSRAIGLTVTDITNPFFAELTISIEAHLDEADYAVLLTHTGENVQKQHRLLETMRGYQVDGLILCPAEGTTGEALGQFIQWNVPFVLVARYLPDLEADYVGMDNILGARLALDHLLEQGHQRIAFIGGPETASARYDRLAGYQEALIRHGISAAKALTVPSAVSREGGYQAVRHLLEHPDPPTAALCYNDVVAFGAMLGLEAEGRRVGRDFALVGFDNVADAALVRPSLTTIGVPPSEMGKMAAALLLDRIQDPELPAQKHILSPKLIIRQSSR